MWNDPPQERAPQHRNASKLTQSGSNPLFILRLLNAFSSFFFFSLLGSRIVGGEQGANKEDLTVLVWHACLAFILPPSPTTTIKGYTRQ